MPDLIRPMDFRAVRKTIASNAITINGEKQSDPEYFFKEEDRLFGRFTLLRRGKKNYCLICWK